MTGPPVVLLHGLGSTSEHGWRATGWVDLLTEAGRAVTLVDLPGHGIARRPADPDDYPDVAAEVAERFAGLGTVDAIGFSAGARLLAESAARGLASFHRLALLGVGPALLDPRPDGITALADALASGDESSQFARVMLRVIRRAGNDPASVSAFLRRPAREITRDDLAAITCPVLVVTGEQDTAGPAGDLAALLPSATAVTLPGAGHFPVQGDPRTIEAVLAFLGL